MPIVECRDVTPNTPRFIGAVWLKTVCVILAVVGVLLLFAREQAKSLFGFDRSKLEAIVERWKDAGCPSGTNLEYFVEKRSEFLVSTQSFLVGTQKLQSIFTLRDPRIVWKGGQLFVTTNQVLVLHTETEKRIVNR
jgi:hypothetical protein